MKPTTLPAASVEAIAARGPMPALDPVSAEATSPSTRLRIASRAVHAAAAGYTLAVYVSMSHLRIAPQRADELVAAFRERVGLVDGFDGFEGLEVWRSDREPDEVIMVSRWRDRACFREYMRSDAHRVSHDRIPADLQAAIKLERLDHLHTYDVVAR